MIRILIAVFLLTNSFLANSSNTCQEECHGRGGGYSVSQQTLLGTWSGNLPMTTVRYTESSWVGVADWGLMASIKYSIASNQNDFINAIGISPTTYIASINIAMMSTGLSGLARSQLKRALSTIKTIKLRKTKGGGRLDGNEGDPGVRLEFKDGTYFDMTRQRVKQTEINPKSPSGYSPVRYDNPLNKRGDKRAPTAKELDWFDRLEWNNL